MKKYLYGLLALTGTFFMTVFANVVSDLIGNDLTNRDGKLIPSILDLPGHVLDFFLTPAKIPLVIIFATLVLFAGLIQPYIPKVWLASKLASLQRKRMQKWRVREGLYCKVGQQAAKATWEINLREALGNGVYGPYIRLEKGIYQVTFHLKIDNNSGNQKLGHLDIVSELNGKLGENVHEIKNLVSSSFPYSDQYREFILDLVLQDPAEKVEFRLVTVPNPVEKILTFDYVGLRKIR